MPGEAAEAGVGAGEAIWGGKNDVMSFFKTAEYTDNIYFFFSMDLMYMGVQPEHILDRS